MERVIWKERIPSRDKRLNRHIHHDERSRNYTFDTTGLKLANTTHVTHIGILDQAQVGSCVAETGTYYQATTPIFEALPKTLPYPLTQPGAYALYSDLETFDGDGPYPPNDFGSSGLTLASVLKNKGVISSYQHTFTLNDALLALTQYPIAVGIYWYDGMFTPDADGRVNISGFIAGGHEIIGYKLDVDNQRVWFHNSWSNTWGVNGDFYLTWADLGNLLSQQGDVIVMLPLNVNPAPVTTTTSTTHLSTTTTSTTHFITTTTTTHPISTTTTSTKRVLSQAEIDMGKACHAFLTATGQ